MEPGLFLKPAFGGSPILFYLQKAQIRFKYALSIAKYIPNPSNIYWNSTIKISLEFNYSIIICMHTCFLLMTDSTVFLTTFFAKYSKNRIYVASTLTNNQPKTSTNRSAKLVITPFYGLILFPSLFYWFPPNLSGCQTF